MQVRLAVVGESCITQPNPSPEVTIPPFSPTATKLPLAKPTAQSDMPSSWANQEIPSEEVRIEPTSLTATKYPLPKAIPRTGAPVASCSFQERPSTEVEMLPPSPDSFAPPTATNLPLP